MAHYKCKVCKEEHSTAFAAYESLSEKEKVEAFCLIKWDMIRNEERDFRRALERLSWTDDFKFRVALDIANLIRVEKETGVKHTPIYFKTDYELSEFLQA